MARIFQLGGVGLALLATASGVAFGQGPDRGQRRPELVVMRGKLGEWVGADTSLYRVVNHVSGLRSYKLKYNQGGETIHPGFASDRLAVIELEIRNVSDHPILPPVFLPALTDSDGARTTGWKLDARQRSFVTEGNRPWNSEGQAPEEIAVGQVAKVALVFSISPKAVPTSLEFAPRNYRTFPFGSPGYRPESSGDPSPGPGFGFGGRNPSSPRNRIVHLEISLTSPSTTVSTSPGTNSKRN